LELLMNLQSNETCPLCGRALGTVSIDEHHLVPKTFKGKQTITLHKICHNAIHGFFSERELLKYYFTIERLLENEHIQSFVKWVARKPPEFYDGTKETADRKSKRRR
jgi:hypothetical protein